MAKLGKRTRAARAAFEGKDNLPVRDAVELVKANASAKFDETVEVSVNLGVDPRHADQMVRGTVNLPHGTGKTARVLVFAAGEKAEAALEAGADEVGTDELVDEVAGGYLDFDAVVATPDMMGKVGRLGRVLGPRGLMPNPKTGTVTADVAKAVNDIKGGKINFRVDKQANLHFVIGKASFDEKALAENYGAALDEIAERLLEEERVAAGALDEGLGDRVGELPLGRLADEREARVARERPQLDLAVAVRVDLTGALA